MTAEFDPRPWNIVAGLAGLALLGGGCGGRTISADSAAEGTGDASTSNTSSTDAGTDSSSTDASTGETDETGDECVNSSDCPAGYYCNGGTCEYEGYLDGNLWYECYVDDECGTLSVCESYICNPVAVPSACDPAGPDLAIPVNFDGQALALAFTDVDGDGDDELVVVTQDQLLVFEAGGGAPTASPRQVTSPSVDAAAAGQFDANPGEDVVLAVGSELMIHSSDGLAGFVGPSVVPSPIGPVSGLRAGDFDGQASTDLLLFGDQGAVIDHGGGQLTSLGMQTTHAAAVREQGLAGAGLMLRSPLQLEFYDLGGSLVAAASPSPSAIVDGSSPIAAYMTGGVPYNLSSSQISRWTLFEQWDPAGAKQSEWGLEVLTVEIAVADFDGDGDDELALRTEGGGVSLQRPDSDAGCIRALELDPGAVASELAVGDHDGDGDDELAIRLADGGVVIVTVGG
ncbi:hypothetical protein DB30_06114 [Enhygromyxa salina]|uniref:FG-GAP repeat protein n=1 Tax=Enhygromyxa salina TaxID=215803 RepID=A0A0C2D4T2_9BACT|nr:hypothetical protein [Enhygromyxa salina]KIG15082.1 hypothetical protein DB30_06114 [Enhygromyxa salina]